MGPKEIADHLRDSRNVDEDDAEGQAKWIHYRLDFSPMWDQVDALLEELRRRPADVHDLRDGWTD